jgi:hypothetical protein
LLTREEQKQPYDEEQEEQILKKSFVMSGETAKHSQVFSDMCLNRADKVSSKQEAYMNKYSFDHGSRSQLNKYDSEITNTRQVKHATNILPKVLRNSK